MPFAVSPPPPAVLVAGHSVQGRRIVATRLGDPQAPRRVLVVGNIHGSEPAGTLIVAALRRRAAIAGVQLWLVRSVNPDGLLVHRRTNAHGVDLNRNFARGWRRIGGGRGDASGARPFSEPEARAVRTLVRRVRPQLTVWYHQPWGQVLAPCHGPAPLQRRYAAVSGVPLRRCRGSGLPGTATRWQQAALPRCTAFVVELRAGRPDARAVRRHAAAIAAISSPAG